MKNKVNTPNSQPSHKGLIEKIFQFDTLRKI